MQQLHTRTKLERECIGVITHFKAAGKIKRVIRLYSVGKGD